MTEWDDAVAAVRAGTAPATEARALVAAMTTDERRWCLDGDLPFWTGLADMGTGGYHRRPFRAARVERLGIPGFAFSDGPRGVVIGPATCFPVSMARGATWDTDLEERIGEAIGTELRAVGADLYGGVCVNILRHPAWGRAQETYGEDPHHVGELGAALTRGVQRHVMATVKHFACNSMENARFKVDVEVDDQALHEVFLPHFKRIVDEGVACVMSAYNFVNGEQCGQSHQLLRDVLRGEWGFTGFVISDWIYGLRDAGPSITAGLDVEMPSPMMRWAQLDTALAAGECTWADIDACVTRTLTALLRYAVSDGAQAPRPDLGVLACDGHRALAREAAAKSIVLLRNESVGGAPVLPLDPGALRRVAVIGRLADARNLGDGGSSDVYAPAVVTALAGLRAALPHAEVVYDDGTDPTVASEVAASADVAMLVVGYTKDDEGEYIGDAGTRHLRPLLPPADDPVLAAAFTAAIATDPGPEPPAGAVSPRTTGGFSTGGDRTSLALHAPDEALIVAVAAAQPRTVVAVVAGSAVVMEAWRHEVPAIMQLWYSGMEGGHALADVLLGHVDPSGRLPFSVPTDASHLPPFDIDADAVAYDGWHGYWRLARDHHEPAHPFGFGLSYTSWALGSATLDRDGDDLVVRATLTNTGLRDGTDVVQVYGGRPADASRPARRLLGFTRVEMAAGATAPVEIRIPLRRLEVRVAGAWQLVRGTYVCSVARHSADQNAC
ncbi:MAG: glycoside hydrolase family 3 C-terminal domain-containing protein, partial [Acidimicrobiales bacterium]